MIWNSTLKRHKPLPRATKPINRSNKPIAKVAKKRAVELRKYEKEKAEYLEANPVCQFPGCERTEITLHHKKGRMGKMVYNKKHFCGLCWEHHSFAEGNPEEAKALNISDNRLTKL